jgi:hypothetical protein
MSPAELEAKFIDNVAPLAGHAKARALADMILRLEELPQASALFDRLFE